MAVQHKLINEQDQQLPAEHRGMPAREAQPQPDLVNKQVTQKDASTETSLRLPHERDQSEAMTAAEQAPVIKQAFADAMSGIKDTSKEPEMLDTYEKQKK